MDKRRARTALVITAAIHLLHDGLSSFLYVLFPIWQREFILSFTEIGFLRACYSGALALFQIPAGYLAERWGEARVLAAGTALTALGFLTLGAVGGVVTLLVVLVAAGLGSGTQHPLGASLVSRAYEGGPQRFALGTFNFSGDLGKMLFPACAAFAFTWVGWRASFPPFFGLLSDWTSVRIAFAVLAGVVALTIPLAGILRGSLQEKR